jgi:HEAT repeat protein
VPLSPEERREVLQGLLGSTSVAVRLLAARVASEQRWTEAVPALRTAADEAREEDRDVILAALDRLTPNEERAHG